MNPSKEEPMICVTTFKLRLEKKIGGCTIYEGRLLNINYLLVFTSRSVLNKTSDAFSHGGF